MVVAGTGDPEALPPAGQSLREFRLPSGHRLTFSVDVDVMKLQRLERKFVMGIVDQIEEHVEKNTVDVPPAVFTVDESPADEVSSS